MKGGEAWGKGKSWIKGHGKKEREDIPRSKTRRNSKFPILTSGNSHRGPSTIEIRFGDFEPFKRGCIDAGAGGGAAGCHVFDDGAWGQSFHSRGNKGDGTERGADKGKIKEEEEDEWKGIRRKEGDSPLCDSGH